MTQIKFDPGYIYKNRSFSYIAPMLNYWGETFSEKFNKLTKIAFGVGDKNKNTKGIYVLFDTNGTISYNRYLDIGFGRNLFFDTLDFFKKQSYYIEDYAYDDIALGHQHMIVFKLPEDFKESIDKFKEGKYSEIYSNPESYVRKKTNKGEYNDAYKVLTKCSTYFHKFNQTLRKDFDVLLEENDGRELDYPPILSEEIF